MNKNSCILGICNFPEKFIINNADKLYTSYHFDSLNIRNVLYYSNYIGVEREKQRLFAIVFMRCMPQYILGEGSIELDICNNRLNIYLQGYNPINLAHIE